MRTSTTWTGTITAASSIVHGGERRGTISLLRREMIRLPDKTARFVPVISGNGVRGALRRVAAGLFVDALDLERQLSLPAAQILRGGGGALHRSSKAPLTGARLQRLRELVPPIAAFGGTTNRTIGGALQVGKVRPHLAETAHLTGAPGPPMFEATQLESYTRSDDDADLAALLRVPLTADGSPDTDALTALDSATPATAVKAAGPMLFRVETFPAGTPFTTWLRLERATPLLTAFTTDVINTWSARGRLGGRRGTGHGCITASWERTCDPAEPPPVDWRTHLSERRDDILTALHDLP